MPSSMLTFKYRIKDATKGKSLAGGDGDRRVGLVADVRRIAA
jgi:hypothetical protein